MNDLDLQAAFRKISELEDKLDYFKANLWHYGKHLSGCVIWKNKSMGCDCGWVAVRSTLAPEKQSSNAAFNAVMAPTPAETICESDQALRTGTCEKCGKEWKVSGPPSATISVLAFNCTCGHVTK